MFEGEFTAFPMAQNVWLMPNQSRSFIRQLAALSRDLHSLEKLPANARNAHLEDLKEKFSALNLSPEFWNHQIQNISQAQFQHFGEVISYLRLTKAPFGRLILQKNGINDTQILAQSDGVCVALTLIENLSDIALGNHQQINLPQDEWQKYGVNAGSFALPLKLPAIKILSFQAGRAYKLLKAASPIGKKLTGRMGFLWRVKILHAQKILQKLEKNQYHVSADQLLLDWKDKRNLLKRALYKK